MSRLKYSIKNAKVALLFYLLMLLLNFFSRRVFIEALGADLVGLTASVQGYIGMLNLADMGISAALAALLYAPLYAADQRRIVEIVSIYGYLFRCIGIVIAVAGVTLSLFLPIIFAKDGVDMWSVYIAFYCFLTTTLLSYLVNYKQNLLVANQQNYIVVTILNTTTVIKTVLQIILLKWFSGGLATWLSLELISALVFALWLELRIRREYPWLRSKIRLGRSLLKEYPEVILNIRRVFSHKIAGYAMQESDKIVVQILMGVEMVTYYGNYTIIASRLIQLITGTLSSNFAGVGNLIAEGDRSKIKMVFWQMNAMYYWIGGVAAFGFFYYISPLIVLWLPSGYIIFPTDVLLFITINLYIYIVRQPIGYYVSGYALFGDMAAAWIEAGINLGISITCGILYGIIGVVVGTAVSTFLVVILWRPHYLYTRGFGETSGREYWARMVKYGALLAVVWLSVAWGAQRLTESGLLPSDDNWIGLTIHALTVVPIVALLYGAVMWITDDGMKAFVRLAAKVIKGR